MMQKYIYLFLFLEYKITVNLIKSCNNNNNKKIIIIIKLIKNELELSIYLFLFLQMLPHSYKINDLFLCLLWRGFHTFIKNVTSPEISQFIECVVPLFYVTSHSLPSFTFL